MNQPLLARLLVALPPMFPVCAQPIAGLWDATISVSNIQIPFGIEFSEHIRFNPWPWNSQPGIGKGADSFAGESGTALRQLGRQFRMTAAIPTGCYAPS